MKHFKLKYHDIGWGYWTTMVVLLAGGLAGYESCFRIAIALGLWQTLHYAWRFQSVTAFPVQVRLTYLGFLILSQWEPLQFYNWVLLIGTSALISVGYCLLARMLSLLPWNREAPMSRELVARTFLSPPVAGNILQGLAAD